jgi:hypothetical protein
METSRSKRKKYGRELCPKTKQGCHTGTVNDDGAPHHMGQHEHVDLGEAAGGVLKEGGKCIEK